MADPSRGLPSPQRAQPSTHVAAGAPRPIGADPGRCSCHSGSCMCTTHTCPRHLARISRTAPPTCALCSASIKILGVGTTLATGKLSPQAPEPFRVEPGWAEPAPGGGAWIGANGVRRRRSLEMGGAKGERGRGPDAGPGFSSGILGSGVGTRKGGRT